METSLGSLFENSGLIADGKPVSKRIRQLTIDQIGAICEQSCDISSHPNIKPQPSMFSHTASSALGADRQPCASNRCRLQKVKELTQFAALYSDKVYIRNFFSDYDSEALMKQHKQLILRQFADDLLVFSALLPLVESGRVQFVTFQGLCPHCLSLEALRQNAKIEYDNAIEELRRRYYKDVDFSLGYEEGIYIITAYGPDVLVPPHGTSHFMWTDPTELVALVAKEPRIAERAKTAGEVKLTTAQAKRIKAGEKLYSPIINSIAFELGGAHFLKTSYLSDSDLEVNFIRSLSSDPIVRRNTALMTKYLTCLVPFIDLVDTSNLIKLRETEGEAFTLFRAALTRAIDEYKSHGYAFTERDAQAVYADIIQPRLATLDAKIRFAKRSFRKEAGRKVLGWVGAISIGLYTGIFTANPMAGAAAFGAAKAGAELLESVMTKSDVEETIKQDDMYFLWRVRELAKARTPEIRHY